MARSSRTDLQVLTANRLQGGEVVYACTAGWTGHFAEAEIFSSGDVASERLQAAEGEAAAGGLLEPYLFDVEPRTGGGYRPVSIRERIRARGPSVRPDLGKQATA